MWKTSDFFQINKWDTYKFLRIIFALQVALLGVISLDAIGIHIQILRQLIGFIYLTFVPGLLIIRALKLDKLDVTENLVYAIGLSLSTIMFIGFFMNFIYPTVGISKPISLIPLVITISIVTVFLSVFCYIREKDLIKDSNQGFIKDSNLYTSFGHMPLYQLLILILMPILSILGTYLVNQYESNILLMSVIFMIALITVLISFDKFLSPEFYPLAVWVMSISLIFHVSLISRYIIVNDVVGEYHCAELVIKQSLWDWNISGKYNSALSNVIIAPVYYYFCNLELTWIFKIVYPLLFSFTSIGVYHLFLKETRNPKVAFLSSFLFISIRPFFSQVPFITKQSTAEIFLICVFLAVFNNSILKTKKSIILIIFSASVVLSHYGISYLFMGLILFMSSISFIGQNIPFIGSPIKRFLGDVRLSSSFLVVSPNFVLIFSVLTLGWYIYVSKSSSLISLITIGQHILNTIASGLFIPGHSRGVYLLIKPNLSILHFLNKLLYISFQSFIVIGFLITLKNYKNTKFDKIYLYFSSYFLILLLAAIVVPRFAVMDPKRLFQLSVFLLAPFCIVGIEYFLHKMFIFQSKEHLNIYKLSSIFFVFFLLFETGFIYELAKDEPSSVSISQQYISTHGSPDQKASLYSKYIPTQNIFSGKWISSNFNTSKYIYRCDWVEGYPSLTIYGGLSKETLDALFLTNNTHIREFDNDYRNCSDSYFQLTYLNIVEGIGSTWKNELQVMNTYDFKDTYKFFSYKNKIYNNGASQVLF